MRHAGGVQAGQRIQQLAHQPPGRLQAQRPMPQQVAAERLARHEFEDRIGPPLRLPGVQQSGDIGMVQGGDEADAAAEAAPRRQVGVGRRADDHGAAGAALARLEDQVCAAVAQPSDRRIAGQVQEGRHPRRPAYIVF